MLHPAYEETLTTDVSVADVLSRIAVRRPYFAFDKLKLTPEGDMCAPIKAEQPMGCERGVMAAAEIGRHLAILGSCAAAQRNQKNGQHYYLAWSAHLRQLADPGIELPRTDLIGRARAEFTDKRVAKAETYLIHEPTGQKLHQLIVEYKVLPKKTFERTFSDRRAVTPDVAYNPYETSHLALGDVFVLDDLLSANLQTLDATACAGHFPDYPALPVAILAHILISAAGKLFANVIGIEDAPYTVVDAQVKSEHLAFTDDKLHLVIQHKEPDGENHIFRCRALTERKEQLPFGDMKITLRRAGAE